MRICMLYPYFRPHYGGVERVVEEVSERLGGHDVEVITSRLAGTDETEQTGCVSVRRVSCFFPERFPFPVPKKLGLDLLKLLRDFNPDVVVAHNIVSYFTLTALLWKLFAKKPLVLVLHTTDINYGSRPANALLGVYYFLAGLFKGGFDLIAAPMDNRLFRLKPDAIIPNGVDKSAFKKGGRDNAREKLGLPKEAKIVLFVGRFIPVKGVDNLIRVIKSLPDITFVVVGEGYLKKKIVAETKGVILREPTGDIHLYCQAADVCLIPSLAEGYCLTAIEAYACETPIVGSNTGIIPSLTEHVYEPADWKGMSGRLRELAAGGKDGRKEYCVNDWDEVAAEYDKMLRNAVKKKN